MQGLLAANVWEQQASVGYLQAIGNPGSGCALLHSHRCWSCLRASDAVLACALRILLQDHRISSTSSGYKSTGVPSLKALCCRLFGW